MKKQNKYYKGDIQLSWLKDKRHTTKPYTLMMWRNYEDRQSRYNTKQLAKLYGVSIRTIYKWNSDLKEIKEKWLNDKETK